MIKKVIAIFMTVIMVVSMTTGCTAKTQDASVTPVKQDEGKPQTETKPAENTDMLTWNLGADPKSFDPTKTSDATGGHIINNIFEGLVRDVGGGVIEPALAEKYDISDDGTIYTFHLRKDLKWSDGKPLTAKDFEYAWKRACNPTDPSEYSFILAPYIKGADAYLKGTGTKEDVAVVAVDDLTLKVELNFQVPYFLGLTTFYTYMPVRQDIVEANGDGWEKNPETCVSNGPFKVEEYKVGSHLMLVKNENYWDAENVKVPKIKVLMIEEAVTALGGYEAGEIAVLGGGSIPPDELPRLRTEDPYMTTNPEIGIYYGLFNVDAFPVDDIRVRQALSLAIDRKKLCEQVLKGGQLPATGMVPPSLSFSDGTCFRKVDAKGNPMPEYGIDPNKASVEEAKKLLADAGYPDGKDFPEVTYSYSNGDTHKKVAEALQEMWKTNLNIDVKLENMEGSVLLKERQTGNYVMARGGWYGDYADPMTMLDLFTSYSGNNDPQWRWNEQPAAAPWDKVLNPANKGFDEAIDKAQKTIGKDRDEALLSAEKIMMDDLIILPLFYQVNVKIIDESVVENVKLATMGQWIFKYAELVK